MLRRRTRVEIFAAVFLEAGRRVYGRPERYAGIFAARGGSDADAEQEAACRAVPARRSRRIEYRRAVWGIELLSHASDDCDSSAKTWRPGFGACTCKPRVEW